MLRIPVLLGVLLVLSTGRAHAHGDLHLQIVQLSAQLAQTPENAELWHKRGELYRAHHEVARACADYDRAEQLDPTLRVVQLSRGRALYETGSMRPSLHALDKFLSAAPGHPEALLLRARVYQRLGKRDHAERDFADALSASPDPAPDLFLERALNLSRAGRDEDALAVLSEGSARLGPLVTLDEGALTIELRLQRYEAALARIDAMLSRVARTEHLLARKAEILERAGQPELAHDTRRQALAQLEALPDAKQKLASNQALKRALSRGLAMAAQR
jgi:tetratricopeptide (TPR) repeat protein